VPSDDQRHSSDDPDPDPGVTSGLDAGGGVVPGDTPPESDQLSGASGDARQGTPNMGPVSGSRGPMVITLVVLAVVVVMVAILTGASFFASD
jgi:hypothetical protein